MYNGFGTSKATSNHIVPNIIIRSVFESSISKILSTLDEYEQDTAQNRYPTQLDPIVCKTNLKNNFLNQSKRIQIQIQIQIITDIKVTIPDWK